MAVQQGWGTPAAHAAPHAPRGSAGAGVKTKPPRSGAAWDAGRKFLPRTRRLPACPCAAQAAADAIPIRSAPSRATIVASAPAPRLLGSPVGARWSPLVAGRKPEICPQRPGTLLAPVPPGTLEPPQPLSGQERGTGPRPPRPLPAGTRGRPGPATSPARPRGLIRPGAEPPRPRSPGAAQAPTGPAPGEDRRPAAGPRP